MEIPDHVAGLLKTYIQDKKQQLELNMKQWISGFKNWEKSISRLYIVILLILIYVQNAS